MKNITLSIDEDILRAGREYARSRNMSFNALVRRLIEQAVVPRADRWLDDTISLMDRAGVKADGERWTRDELYRGGS